MTTGSKTIIAVIVVTILILGGAVWFLTSQTQKEEAKLTQPKLGEVIPDEGAQHIPSNETATYNTNPPTSGPHYAQSADAGIYEKAIPDGNLIHSMEHGAVILWYRESTQSGTLGLSKEEINKLKGIFSSVPVSKKIMVPRESLDDAPIVLTSWGRLLKLQTIEEDKIKTFMETNENRGPEKAPL
ncbi:DUF3105 domain-containing protein [Candidatus Daviesbacteria bacterium]|nr:DUF3105 domain-containing protein [Candidatus Daviesbacteria bacterium]